MPRSEPAVKKPRPKKAPLHRLPVEPAFKADETAVLYEPDAPFGELCFVRVVEATRARVEVAYYGLPLFFVPGSRTGGAWVSKCGRWCLERRSPERVAASLRRRCGVPDDGCGPGAANEKE